MASTRLAGHALRDEGRAFVLIGAAGGPRWARADEVNAITGSRRGIAFTGVALCECGWTSAELRSDANRRADHREHKQEVRRARVTGQVAGHRGGADGMTDIPVPPEAVPADPHPEGNPALAAAVGAILSRRLAAGYGIGQDHARRAVILLDALPDAAAALEAAAPIIAAAERERLAAVIPAADFRKLADWFDTDDLFKETMFPGEWPPGSRGDAWQRNLRRFADLIGDPDA